ncbi:hypothetical protein AXK11_04065 [Cephaloticoccus primus]|uniref:FecR protein domain-containing protein n=1 Tax=Cephaloticoccus primus TaxID=1548207 RepID=A0A139SPJ8_9BACT|nr:hypothetical protein [Cephaloticoccus primus]KXU36535.1 hypothetical protein AXK11_04065 [Cephaloticoccus primus]
MATHLKPRLGLALAALVAALGTATAQAQTPVFYGPSGDVTGSLADNLISKLYAVEVDGEAYLENHGVITPLSAREVHIAEGSTVYTEEASTTTLVISNGTGLFLNEDGRFSITRAAQEPFVGERGDLIAEPSVSNIQIYHESGVLGVCTSRLLPDSLLEIVTDEAVVRIPDGKLVFERNREGTWVTLVGGDASAQAGKVYYAGQGRDLNIHEKIFFPADGGEPTLTKLSGRDLSEMEGIVTIACLARRSVYFDAPGDIITTPDQAEGPGDGIIGVPTTPGTGGGGPGGGGGGTPPTTVQPPPSTVSPAAIP